MQNDKKIQKLILAVMSVSLLWAGGYYEYTGAILGGIMLFILIFFAVTFKNNKEVRLNPGLLFSGMITLFYTVTCFFATDRGMAFTGTVKKSAVFIFAVLILYIEETQRKKLVQMLPHLAVVVCLAGMAGMLIPEIKDFVIKNGRFFGTIGYANTFALLMLLGIVVAVLKLSKSDIINIIEIVIMFAGLWFSGSRYTWVLFVFLMILLLIHINVGKIKFVIPGIMVCAGIILSLLFKNSGGIGRFFSDNLSTMYGRFLYWQDALVLLKKHPFGMGYLGYYYEQTQVQTGVYTVRFVHNDILQLALDIGIIPMIVIVVLLLAAVFNRQRDYVERILIFTIVVHSIFEFDLEHTAVMFVLVLLLSCSNENFFGRCHISMNLCKYMGIVAGVICIYMAFPLSLYVGGNDDEALKMYPIYTDAAISKLSATQDADEGRRLAEQILNNNDTVSIAYSALAQVACQEEKFEKMSLYEKKAIERNKFDGEQYVEYLSLLNDALGSEKVMSSEKLTNMIIMKMKEVPKIIEKNKTSVSRLGKKINDKVDIDLDKELLREIEGL